MRRARPASFPLTLRDALLLRVERLSPAAQSALRIAAAAGPRIDHRLLAAVAGLPDAELHDALREAVSHHLLAYGSGESYAFRHALVREVVYADLLPGERASVHAALAHALSGSGDVSAPAAAERARHWWAARELSEALAASVEAGRAADRIGGFPEARRHYERALELWERVDDPQARAGLDRIDLTRRAAEAAHLASEHDRAIALAQLAATSVDAARDPVRAGLIRERLGRYLWVAGREADAAAAYRDAVATLPAEPPSAERARVVAAEGQLLMLNGRAREAIARCEEALAVARPLGARAEEGQALNTLGIARSGLGDRVGGEEALRRAFALARELDRADDIGRAYVNLGDCVDQAGRIEEAAELALAGAEACRALGLGGGYRCLLLTEAAHRCLRLGRADEAERLADEAIELRPGGLAEGLAHGTRALVDVARGAAPAARERFAAARERLGAGASITWTGPIDAGAAELELWERRPAAARDTVARALARAEGAEYAFVTARATWIGTRAEADLAEMARALPDAPPAHEARARAAALCDRLDAQIAAEERGGSPAPELLLYRALCAGERTRLAGEPDPAAWAPTGARADALGMPAAAAYARWREAEAALTLGLRDAAVTPLRAAAAVAAALGAQPLLDEIRVLARRGRVELGAADGTAEPSAAERLEAHRARARRAPAGGDRPHQPRDRRAAVHEPEDRQRSRLPDPAQARRARAGRGGRRRASTGARVTARAGPARRRGGGTGS